MAKSKNATSHHNARKHHRNGIKKLRVERYTSLKGVFISEILVQPAICQKQEIRYQERSLDQKEQESPNSYREAQS